MTMLRAPQRSLERGVVDICGKREAAEAVDGMTKDL